MDDGVVISTSPFKHVYTGIDKTVKRALPLEIIKQLKNLDLSLNPRMELARDMFLFSFYTRGMSFIDMAQLTLGNLQGGVLTYRRQKTSQQLHIKWEPAMQEIVAKYMTDDSPYLLPIAKSKNVPVSAISEALGHDSEKTTQIYLSSLDTSVVDNANNLIINSIILL